MSIIVYIGIKSKHIVMSLPHSRFRLCRNLHAETAGLLRLLLELVRDLGVRLEELGAASVKADGLALAELAFAVRLVDAFLGADLDHSVEREIFSFWAGEKGAKREVYLVCISATTLSSFSTAEIFSAEVGALPPKPNMDMMVVLGGCVVGEWGRRLAVGGRGGKVDWLAL